MSMLSNSEDTSGFRAKGAETHGLVEFVVEVFDTHETEFKKIADPEFQFEVTCLQKAGHSACAFDKILEDADYNRMSEHEVEALFYHFMQFSMLYERGGGDLVPKYHLMIHAIQQARYFGNLRHHTTYKSESFNGVLARIAEKLHRANFYEDLFWRCKLLNSSSFSKCMY